MNSAASAAADPPAADPPFGLSAGAMLRGAREKAGLHIGALSVSLKVPVSKLEALEADRLDLLPDAVFARALASTVCRALKLDPGPVLAKLPGHAAHRLRVDARLTYTAFNTPAMGWRTLVLSRLSKPAAVAVAVLLVGALAVLFVPSLERMRGSAESAADAPAASAKLVTSIPSAQAIQAAQDGAPLSAPVVAVPMSAVPAAEPSAPAPGSAMATSNARLAPAAAASMPSDAQSSGASVVVFKTRGVSWVEVIDAAGVVQLRKTMGSGETAGASGTPPLSVTVGRIDSTEVMVRGKSFDLARFSKDNVARFQIK